MDVLKKQSLRKIVLAICGKNGLALSADRRHEIQFDVTGVASLTDMSAPQLEDLISHLRRLQKALQPVGEPRATNEWNFVFKLTPDRRAYGKKIYRLAERCGALQKPPVPVASKAYVEGITEQMRGTKQPLEFCDCEQLRKVVIALEKHLNRKGG